MNANFRPRLHRPPLAALIALACLPLARAADEDSLVPCLACTGDYQPIAANAVVPAEGKQMLGVFHLAAGEKYSRLVSTWIAVDVGPAAPPNYKITEAAMDLAGRHEGVFHYTQPGVLPTGSYRIVVTADGRPWKSAEVTVVHRQTLTGSTAGPLIPLTDGRKWTYDFTQKAGAGVTINLPGATKDAEGRFHATVVMTAGRMASTGSHLTLVRNGQIVSEEWWRLDDRGLVATERRVQGQDLHLNPPQILLATPVSTYQEWDNNAADGSFQQHCRQWCLNPDAGAGHPREFLVVLEQGGNDSPKIVGERHYVLGTGLVREVITMTVGGNLISRTTMVLRPDGGGS